MTGSFGINLQAAAGPEGTRIYVIGDIHGRFDLLERMHALIMAEIERDGPADWRIVLVGDYCDRGPDVRGVIELLLHQKRRDGRVVTLRGNHDEGMLDFFDNPDRDGIFCVHGGLETARSYGVELDTGTRQALRRSRDDLLAAMPGPHLEFLSDLPLSAEFGDFFICHAGIRPGVPLERQDGRDLVWIRSEFLDWPDLHPKVVVHGHTPCREAELLANRVNIDTGAVWTGKLTALVIEGAAKRLIEVRGLPMAA
jgi:serine/threonine protein phosphatase 1